MNDGKIIFGIIEHVSLPELGAVNLAAKIDTGAYNGALHCSKIKEYVRKSDGIKVLKFTPFENHSHAKETADYSVSWVRSSTGHKVKRYIFNTKIVIRDIEYLIRIGLTNRSDMHYDILIGRRFLFDNNILVDVRKNQEHDIDKEKDDAHSDSIKRSR